MGHEEREGLPLFLSLGITRDIDNLVYQTQKMHRNRDIQHGPRSGRPIHHAHVNVKLGWRCDQKDEFSIFPLVITWYSFTGKPKHTFHTHCQICTQTHALTPIHTNIYIYIYIYIYTHTRKHTHTHTHTHTCTHARTHTYIYRYQPN